jgi:hypothetical protein
MRLGVKLIVPLWLLTLAGCERTAHIPAKLRSEYATRIESVLPRNWELNESNGQILISRKEPIIAYNCVNLDISLLRQVDRMKEEIARTGSKQEYKIRLRITPKVEFTEYLRLKTVNDQIKVTRSMTIQNREFFEADAMNSFDPSYRELPEYYDDHSSIYLETTLPPWDCVAPYEAASECEHVLRSLDTLFKLYDPAPRSRSPGWPLTVPPLRTPVPLSSQGTPKHEQSPKTP